MTLNEIANLDSISPDLIFQVMDLVSDNGDVIMIKQDGLRTTKKYTAVLSIAKKERGVIRYDGNSFAEVIKLVLKEYVAQ